jgi:UDP-N-acetylmuramoyl-tripeptide--D-alanyl-D-alanine ligase
VSEPLWSAAAAAAATGGSAHGDWQATGVSIDSRAIEPGDLFIALKVGRDGHDFVRGALAAGAGAALVSDPSCAEPGAPLLVVPDTQVAMEQLGCAARRRNVIARRVAVTGSVGKTTVKEMTAAALEASGRTHRSVKSYNNHWGVPLTLARLPADARFGVFEIGMNHGGEIARLSPQVMPHVAAITMVAPVHIENFADEAGIADSKSEIFLGLQPGGVAVVPNENPHLVRLVNRAAMVDGVSIVRFGMGEGSDARVLSVSEAAGGVRTVSADILGNALSWSIGEPGAHWVHNGLCALTLAHLAGGDLQAAAAALSRFGAIDGRGATKAVRLPGGGFFVLVDEAYNANPASMGEALVTLGGRAGTRRIAVLGDMLELGTGEAAFHAGMAGPVEASGVDLVFCAGPRMKHLWDVLDPAVRGGWAESPDEVAAMLAGTVRAGDVVMVKGSNGSKTWKVVQALQALGTVGDQA